MKRVNNQVAGWCSACWFAIIGGLVCGLAGSSCFSRMALGAEASDGSAEGKVEAYLQQLGLADLRLELLERRLKATKGEEARLALARQLANAAAERMLAVADDAPRFEQLKQRLERLQTEVPSAATPALRMALAQAEYQQAETQLTKWLDDPAQTEALAKARLAFKQIAPALTALALEFTAEANKLAEGPDEKSSSKQQAQAEAAIGQFQLLSAKANYFAGWASYYLGLCQTDVAQAQPHFQQAKTQLLTVLDIGEKAEYSAVEVENLGLDAAWRARAVIGLGLAETGLDNLKPAAICFGWLNHGSVPAGLRDQSRYWRLQALLYSHHWSEALQLASEYDNWLSGKASQGKLSFAVALLRGGLAATEKNQVVGKDLQQKAVQALARMRQFTPLSQLAAKYHLANGPLAQNFYLQGLRAKDLFAQAEKTKAAADYKTAGSLLEKTLAQPEAQKDLVFAAELRFELAWTKFRLEEFEAAATQFQQVVTPLKESAAETASQAAWMTYASYQQLADKNERFVRPAVEALQNLKRQFPGSALAVKADLYIARLLRQEGNPAATLASLEKITPADSTYWDAQYEICQLRFAHWKKSVGNKGAEAPAQQVLLTSVDRFLNGAPAEMSAERRLKIGLLAMESLGKLSDANLAAMQGYLQKTSAAVSKLEVNNPALAEWHYRQLLVAQRQNNLSLAEANAQAISDHAAGSPFELPALIALASALDAKLAKASPADHPALLKTTAGIYRRLLTALGPQASELKSTKNAAAVYSRLAQLEQDLGNWTAAAKLLQVLVRTFPDDKKFLRRAGLADFEAKNFAPALEMWRKLLAGLPPGSPEWFEAKYYQLASLQATDPAAAKQIYKQFVLLYPEVTLDPWKTKFAALAVELGKP